MPRHPIPAPDDPDAHVRDQVAIDRAIAGQPVGRTLSHTEACEVVDQLLAAGWTPTAAATHLGWHSEAVGRLQRRRAGAA